MKKMTDAIWLHISKNPCRLGWWLCAILLVSLSGCGNSATVEGKVTYQGRPVCHGSVFFRSADKSVRSGPISLDGSYTVEGVPRGTAEVGVISHEPAKGHTIERDGKRVRPEKIQGWFPLPTKYETPGTAGVRCTVDAGTVKYDIDLK
jgi:hypothetical protein